MKKKAKKRERYISARLRTSRAQKGIGISLAVVLLFSLMAPVIFATEPDGIYRLELNGGNHFEVDYGTGAESLSGILPSALSYAYKTEDEEGETEGTGEFGIEYWDSGGSYDGNVPGNYTLTPVFTNSSGIPITADVPTVTVVVGAAPADEQSEEEEVVWVDPALGDPFEEQEEGMALQEEGDDPEGDDPGPGDPGHTGVKLSTEGLILYRLKITLTDDSIPLTTTVLDIGTGVYPEIYLADYDILRDNSMAIKYEWHLEKSALEDIYAGDYMIVGSLPANIPFPGLSGTVIKIYDTTGTGIHFGNLSFESNGDIKMTFVEDMGHFSGVAFSCDITTLISAALTSGPEIVAVFDDSIEITFKFPGNEPEDDEVKMPRVSKNAAGLYKREGSVFTADTNNFNAIQWKVLVNGDFKNDFTAGVTVTDTPAGTAGLGIHEFTKDPSVDVIKILKKTLGGDGETISESEIAISEVGIVYTADGGISFDFTASQLNGTNGCAYEITLATAVDHSKADGTAFTASKNYRNNVLLVTDPADRPGGAPNPSDTATQAGTLAKVINKKTTTPTAVVEGSVYYAEWEILVNPAKLNLTGTYTVTDTLDGGPHTLPDNLAGLIGTTGLAAVELYEIGSYNPANGDYTKGGNIGITGLTLTRSSDKSFDAAFAAGALDGKGYVLVVRSVFKDPYDMTVSERNTAMNTGVRNTATINIPNYPGVTGGPSKVTNLRASSVKKAKAGSIDLSTGEMSWSLVFDPGGMGTNNDAVTKLVITDTFSPPGNGTMTLKAGSLVFKEEGGAVISLTGTHYTLTSDSTGFTITFTESGLTEIRGKKLRVEYTTTFTLPDPLSPPGTGPLQTWDLVYNNKVKIDYTVGTRSASVTGEDEQTIKASLPSVGKINGELDILNKRMPWFITIDPGGVKVPGNITEDIKNSIYNEITSKLIITDVYDPPAGGTMNLEQGSIIVKDAVSGENLLLSSPGDYIIKLTYAEGTTEPELGFVMEFTTVGIAKVREKAITVEFYVGFELPGDLEEPGVNDAGLDFGNTASAEFGLNIKGIRKTITDGYGPGHGTWNGTYWTFEWEGGTNAHSSGKATIRRRPPSVNKSSLSLDAKAQTISWSAVFDPGGIVGTHGEVVTIDKVTELIFSDKFNPPSYAGTYGSMSLIEDSLVFYNNAGGGPLPLVAGTDYLLTADEEGFTVEFTASGIDKITDPGMVIKINYLTAFELPVQHPESGPLDYGNEFTASYTINNNENLKSSKSKTAVHPIVFRAPKVTKTAGTADLIKREIPWTVVFNPGGMPNVNEDVQELKFTDTFKPPAGGTLKLIDSSLVFKNNATGEEINLIRGTDYMLSLIGNAGFTVTFRPLGIPKIAGVELRMEFLTSYTLSDMGDGANYLQFRNDVDADYKIGNTVNKTSSTGVSSVTVKENNGGKTGSHIKGTNQIQWEIRVNINRANLGGLTLNDIFGPDDSQRFSGKITDLEIYDMSAVAFTNDASYSSGRKIDYANWSSYGITVVKSPANSTEGFTLSFSASAINGKWYIIRYKTIEEIMPADFTFTDKVIVTDASGLTREFNASVKYTMDSDSSYLDKQASDAVTASDTAAYVWTIAVNKDGAHSIKDAELTDTISRGLILVEGSIKVYAGEAGGAKLTEGTDYILTPAVPIRNPMTYTTTFAIKFLTDVDSKYTVVYETLFDVQTAVGGPGGYKLNNNAHLTGLGVDNWQGVNLTYGRATVAAGGRLAPGGLRVIKKDLETGELLDGAEFEIWRADSKGNKIDSSPFWTFTTLNGINEELKLLAGTYIIVETKAPEGYKLASKNSRTVVINGEKAVSDGFVEVEFLNPRTDYVPPPDETPDEEPPPDEPPPVVPPVNPPVNPPPGGGNPPANPPVNPTGNTGVNPPVDPPQDYIDMILAEATVPPVPFSSFVTDLIDNKVPLGSFGTGIAWSLLNLMMSILALLSSIVLLVTAFKKKQDEEGKDYDMQQAADGAEEKRDDGRRVMALRVIAILAGIIPGLLFLLLENIRLPMVWITHWTPIIGLFFIIDMILVLVHFSVKKREKEPNEEEAGVYHSPAEEAQTTR